MLLALSVSCHGVGDDAPKSLGGSLHVVEAILEPVRAIGGAIGDCGREIMRGLLEVIYDLHEAPGAVGLLSVAAVSDSLLGLVGRIVNEIKDGGHVNDAPLPVVSAVLRRSQDVHRGGGDILHNGSNFGLALLGVLGGGHGGATE